MPASDDEIHARLLAVANNPDRPKAYRHLAQGTADGGIISCGGGLSRRQMLEKSLEIWENDTPPAEELAQLEWSLFGDHRPWWQRWWSSVFRRRASL